MRAQVLLATLLLSVMATAAAQSSATQTQQTTSKLPGATTLTGCLKGSINQYYVVEKNGTTHQLLAKGKDLTQYVNHEVTVSGTSDNNRDASASSDEGTAHGGRFFSVDSVSDQGSCKR
jgi:hypothetical protein